MSMRRSSRISERVEAKRSGPPKAATPPPAAAVAAKPAPKKAKSKAKAKPQKAARAHPAPVPTPVKSSSADDLVPIVNRLDDNIRLLFHLEKFVSLVYFDPYEAKRDETALFREWYVKHDIWEPALLAASNRMERKQITRIQDEVEQTIKEAYIAERPLKRRKQIKQEPEQLEELSISEPEYESEELEPETTLRPIHTGEPIAWTHPSHVVHKPDNDNGSLEKLLDAYKLLDEDQQVDDQKWQQIIDERSKVASKVNAARKSGLLEVLEYQEQLADIPKFVDPARAPTHHDNLMGQIIYMAKLRINQRKIKLANAKKTAQSVELYHKRLAGAEERIRKDQERDRKALHRKLAYEVLKKWKLAEKVVGQRRQQILDEENKQKGKEYLSKILEKSEQLLQNQYTNESLSDEMEALSSEPDISDGSDDSAHEEEDGHEGDEDDANLTMEQLREKYKDAIEQARVRKLQESEDDSDAEDEDEDEDEQAQLTELVVQDKDNNGSSVTAGIDEAELERMNAVYAAEASESDESLGESQSSENASDSDSESGEGDEGENGGSLSMLLGGAAPAEEESDEDVVMSDDAMSDVDMSDSRVVLEESNDPEDVKMEDIQAPEEEEVGDANASAEEAESPVPVTPSHTEEAVVAIEEPPIEVVQREHKIETPFLLRGSLRAYQRDGLDWLAGLYNSQTNGILADEMGLGKTIQTISLLAYLACEKHIWGPHLIVVPTSVMLNWEMEFKRFAPGFKVMTYYGNPQQRKDKRRGWNKEDTWHVCITSYQLVIQDQAAFKRKRWKYMILDEAHNIKNFRSQRWQALLNFNSERRLLLTGTPLQNNLVELWSLLYFLMPSSKGTQMMPEGFANLEDFQEWFSRPVDQMVEEGLEADTETRNTISKLHQVLRPYILRRLKVDVEKQMPGKYEHIIYCKLSKRQRYLYDDFMSRAQTQETLASGNFMGILNCLMQLRKVCNHPDLFEVRPIKTSWAINHSVAHQHRHAIRSVQLRDNWADRVNLDVLNLLFTNIENEDRGYCLVAEKQCQIDEPILQLSKLEPIPEPGLAEVTNLQKWAQFSVERRRVERELAKRRALYLSYFKSHRVPVYGADLRSLVSVSPNLPPLNRPKRGFNWNVDLNKLILGIEDREAQLKDIIARYAFVTPEVVCLDYPQLVAGQITMNDLSEVSKQQTFHEEQVRLSIQFPDKRLLQYDCGKLQKLDNLLRDLIAGGHRVLIFTQMTRVLDILEQFLNIHGWRYLRLDGATKVEERQVLTERFNKDPGIPVFILSTRSGGLGINLTGADTVVFYDSDWNPAMDRQCQDRCHRIGQTRDVHIYRFVSEYTIESNILRKATQKTILDNVVIQEGEFNTDYFKKVNVKEIITGQEEAAGEPVPAMDEGQDFEAALAGAEEADDIAAANMALSEARLDVEEFQEAEKQQSAAPEDETPTTDVAAAAAASNGHAQHLADNASPPTGEEQNSGPHMQEEEHDAIQDIGHVDDYMIRFIEEGYLDSD